MKNETTIEIVDRDSSGQMADVFGSEWGPWLEWLAIALQQCNEVDESVVILEPEASESIIEISSATQGAIEATESFEETSTESKNPPQADDLSGIVAPTYAESNGLPKLTPVPPKRLVTNRNLRTPKKLSDDEAPQPTATAGPVTLSTVEPRVLSGTMKTVPKGAPAKLSLKSAEDDLKAYLAQEEPTEADRSQSADAHLQGVDAEKAQKPVANLLTESSASTDLGSEMNKGPVRAPIVVPEPNGIKEHRNPILARRLQRVQACLDYYLQHPETTTARSPWAVMHAVLPFGVDYELAGPKGRVNAIGWMCHNGLCRTQRMFTPRGNSFVPNVGGGVQGHEGQFLAILAQSQVPLDYPIQIGPKKYTVEDLVRYEMATCKEKSELTFKLIGLSYYVDANKQWRANDGKVWSLQKLVQEELAQPIVGSACGGTHRLMGFSFALKQRVLQGQPIVGQYQRAAKFVEENIRYTWQLQNPDGSFSTNWYESRGNEPNDERKVQTSGHMLEWLMFTVSDSELSSPRVEKAVDFLLTKIYDQREQKWPIGPRGHATRALALYNMRVQSLQEEGASISADSKSSAVSVSVNPPIGEIEEHENPAGKQATAVVRKPQSTNRSVVPTHPQPSRSAARPNRKVRG